MQIIEKKPQIDVVLKAHRRAKRHKIKQTDGYTNALKIYMPSNYKIKKVLSILTVTTLFILCLGSILASANPNISKPKGVTTYNPHVGDTYEVGADDHYITLTNYANAKNPTYEQLLNFIIKDTTDEKPYTDACVCADFAETLHNNAEKAGIKCAWVGCDFKEGGDDHAFNEFETTDKGIVFIDCTGDTKLSGNMDTVANVKIGKLLTEKYLFRNDRTLKPMGSIKSINIYW